MKEKSPCRSWQRPDCIPEELQSFYRDGNSLVREGCCAAGLWWNKKKRCLFSSTHTGEQQRHLCRHTLNSTNIHHHRNKMHLNVSYIYGACFSVLPGEQHAALQFVGGGGEEHLILSDECDITRALLNNLCGRLSQV